ncbi:MAG: MFS transporter [Planctomycetes bacterium]|nr:MFS transporter [Planctomycetota bacterium]
MASESLASDDELATIPHERSLRSKSFLGLLLTQLLGAANDNILRWLVIGVGKQYVDKSQVGWILMAGTASFVLPYLLLAAPAGYLADRFSKQRVIVACKLAEIAIMAIAIIAILIGSVSLLLMVVALMGAQSALFGPSKLGSIPEMLDESKISAANGLIGLTTVISAALGTAIGNWLATATMPLGQQNVWLSATVLIGTAIAGWGASLLIARLPVANPLRNFPWNAAQQTYRDLKELYYSKGIFRVALGIMFFWSLAALAQLNIDQFAAEGGTTRQTQVIPLLIALVVGVGLGSVLAGVWSGGRVELGILPLGAGGLAMTALLLYTVEGTLINESLIDPGTDWTASYFAASFLLLLLGFFGGLFDVPLAAYMQLNSPKESRGSILAASNFLTFAGVLLVALAFGVMRAPTSPGSLEQLLQTNAEAAADPIFAEQIFDQIQAVEDPDMEAFARQYPERKPLVRAVYQEVVGHPLLSARQIFLLCGLLTLPVLVYILLEIPQATIRFLAWLATHTAYKIRVHQRHHLPEEGAALLTPNHVSWLDGLLLVAISQRPIRVIITGDLVTSWWTRGLARIMGAIPISRRNPKMAYKAIETARKALNNGELVCIFPEGRVSRSGTLQKFRPSTLDLLKGTSAPIIPVYLDELWGSIFTYRGGRFFWKCPRLVSRKVSIWFGKKLEQPHDIHELRQTVQELGADAVSGRKKRMMVLPRLMLRKCRKAMFRMKMADTTGAELTGGTLLMRTLILRRLLLREVLQDDERYVGILIPPTVGGAVTNAALALAGRVAVNLNYTVSNEIMNACIRKAGIRHVLTTKKVLEKFDFDMDAEVILLDDFREKVTTVDKLVGATQAFVTPLPILERMLGLTKMTGDDELTVIFTSGSTGVPKGVVLTNHNVGTNVEAIDQVIHLTSEDVLLGVLPFFHSFGYTVTLWTVLGLDVSGIYHTNPQEARQVGKLAGKWGATVMLATPTFLRLYLKRCQPEDFEKLDIVVTGAEKLPPGLADAFEKKFGVRPVEGYGTTELSPLVSVNVPPSRSQTDEADIQEGSVGRPIPGVTAKTVDPETFEDLPIGTAGMLLVKGPNVMQGYMDDDDKTSEVVKDGWYVTGDIAIVDQQGFIKITGRQSRFSKIGGEMVPHINIEEAIQNFVEGEDDENIRVAVTAVPDERKGERLIVVHSQLDHTPQEICDHLKSLGLPNLWIPSPDSFLQVEQIPVLGTGKLDLKGLAELAKGHFGTA